MGETKGGEETDEAIWQCADSAGGLHGRFEDIRTMKYVIDGYNVIHKITELKGKRLRSQREGLIRLLEIAGAADKRFKDLTVVFDGKFGVLTYPVQSAVRIIFSKGGCADKKIKQIVECSNFARDICVVSDDRQIRHYAGTLGAKKVTVEEFLKKVSLSCQKKVSFKLDAIAAQKINRELEKIWLNK